MTRASLLHILDHVNGISDVEIRELEQLAAAFPYCQTAHVLLAKAAHDRGSMLAGQRLRRAATYAPDRDLLRQLLESTAVVTAAQPAAEHFPPAFAAQEPPLSIEPEEAPEAVAADSAEALPVGPETDADEPLPVDEQSATEAAAETAVAEDLPTEFRSETVTLETVSTESIVTETVAPELSREDEALFTSWLPDLAENPAGVPLAAESAAPTDVPEPESSADEAPTPISQDLPAVSTEESTTEPVTDADLDTSAADDLLPAVAPPIRPPADAGISRFEFGLGQSELPAPTAYQLPGLDEEDDNELPTLSKLPAAPQPVVTAPFRADADLGYALGAGSRLGYDLQARDGYTLDLPLDAFFEPDALLLAHLKAHKPKPATSSLDLINRFLKTQPRIKTPAGMPLPAEQQPDLSVRSAGVAPALASESLAKIMVRQGKKDKAIEIYERLMARQPEKKAYFAEQIQQLQQPSE